VLFCPCSFGVLFECGVYVVVIIFIVCSVSFIVCVVLCDLFCLSMVCYLCVVSYCLRVLLYHCHRVKINLQFK
jgi:hypothetical protein